MTSLEDWGIKGNRVHGMPVSLRNHPKDVKMDSPRKRRRSIEQKTAALSAVSKDIPLETVLNAVRQRNLLELVKVDQRSTVGQ